jgi:hypothetical protein
LNDALSILGRFAALCRNAQAFAAMFHGKPTTYDILRSSTQAFQELTQPSKAIAHVQAKINSRNRCKNWIKEVIAKSPNHATHNKEQLWAEATQKWPGTLTRRQFLAARMDAIAEMQAVAWSAGGRRKNAVSESPH